MFYKLMKLRPRRFIVCIALVVLVWVVTLDFFTHHTTIFQTGTFHTEPNIIDEETTELEMELENISCHYAERGDALPRADESFQPPARSIFFTETSCKGGLDPRQACVVESAARVHPEWQINVLFAAPVTNSSLQTGSLFALRNHSNVKFSRVRLEKYAKGTPLESLMSGGALNRSRWRITHTSDVVRLLTLYKFEGIYLDLDALVVRPLDWLVRNWVAREDNYSVANGAMAFSGDEVGRSVVYAAIRDMAKNFRGDVWGHNGPALLMRVLRERCAGAKPPAMSAATCNGFEVYGPEFFYPVSCERRDLYFKPGEIDERTAYVFHFWNKSTCHLKVHKESPLAKLARRYCPDIYKLYKTEFGHP